MRKMNRAAIILFCCMCVCGSGAYGETLEERLTKPLAVEKLIGTAETNIFAGRVGSLQIVPAKNTLFITEWKSLGTYVVLEMSYFELVRIGKLANYIDFDCVDDIGYDWRGKIWRDDEGAPVQVEMYRKDAPHRWVTLGKEGQRFLKENNMTHLDLGFNFSLRDAI